MRNDLTLEERGMEASPVRRRVTASAMGRRRTGALELFSAIEAAARAAADIRTLKIALTSQKWEVNSLIYRASLEIGRLSDTPNSGRGRVISSS